MVEFWAEWGTFAYVIAAIWAFFEGETFVLLAAAAGRASLLINPTPLINPWTLMFSVWGGSFLGDQCWFLLGRRYGIRVVRRIPGAERRTAKAMEFVERYGAMFILSFRFAYGIRNVASVACGMSGMHYGYFAALNFVAAGFWASSFVAAGWFLAEWLGPENVGWALGGLGLAVIGWLIMKARRPTRGKQAVPVTPAQ